jgi:hypothetical protein
MINGFDYPTWLRRFPIKCKCCIETVKYPIPKRYSDLFIEYLDSEQITYVKQEAVDVDPYDHFLIPFAQIPDSETDDSLKDTYQTTFLTKCADYLQNKYSDKDPTADGSSQ